MLNAGNTKDNLIKLADEKAQQEDFFAAIELYKKHLKNDPHNPVIYNRIGHLYGRENKYEFVDEQIKYFKKALEIDPNYSGAIRNLALLYSQIDKIEEAEEYFHKLFQIAPVTDDYFAYACMKIKTGNFEEGWKYYEFRFLKGWGREDYIQTSKPRWEGEDLTDKTLLVQYEQGYGDSIQFARYIDLIKNYTKKIIFRVQNELVDLFKINFKDIDIVGHSTPIESLLFDYHTPLLSLVRLTNSTIDSIPLSQGYLKADDGKKEHYKKEFFNNNGLKIGIAWSGTQVGNHSRDIPLACYYPLSEGVNVYPPITKESLPVCMSKGVNVYSFQKGFGSQQLKNVPENINIIDLGKTFKDFSDTSAAMANLDMFITSDNALLNLAGAMGIKTCLMLNKYSEWRWFFDEEKTPWYDSVKIYKKQTECEKWDLLMQKIIQENFK